MKKRLLIICSIIGVLLAGFQFPIYAETTPPDYSSSTSIMASTPLDQYFYDNYDLLPYIESDGSQYINTSINVKSNLKISVKFSDVVPLSGSWNCIFGGRKGSNTSTLGVQLRDNAPRVYSYYDSLYYQVTDFNKFAVYNLVFDNNDLYLNSSLLHEFTEGEFSSDAPLYIFAMNNDNSAIYDYSIYKLYSFSIYDYDSNDGEGALVRDYYPARSKSSGIIGLYDAISKTFVTTSGSVPFASPTNDNVLNFQITDFLTASLDWIGAIFEGINEMPIIWVFIAIALAGVAFRWARRIVHF